MENKKPFIITVAIMALIIVGMGTYIFIDKMHEKEEKEKKTSVINNTVIDLNSFFQVSDTLRRFDIAFNDAQSNYLGYLYNSKRIYASKFDIGASLYASIVPDMIENNNLMYISEDKVKGNFERMFGKNLDYQPAEINRSDFYVFNYEDTANRYAYIAVGKNTQYPAGYIAMNIKTILEGDIIQVTRKIFYGEYIGENDIATKIVMYKDATKQRKIGEVNLKNGAINQAEIIAKYSSKINTYVYTFKHNKGSDYSFYLIEKGK